MIHGQNFGDIVYRDDRYLEGTGRTRSKQDQRALLVGVAVPAIHDPAEVRGVEGSTGHGGHWRENHLK